MKPESLSPYSQQRATYPILSQINPVHVFQSTSRISIFILFFHLYLGPQVSLPKPCMHVSPTHTICRTHSYFFPLLSFYRRINWFRGFLQYFLTWLIFYGKELLAPRPTPKLEDHLLSAVHDCVFNIFAATLHIWRPFLHLQPEDAPSRVGRDFTKTEYNYITSVYKMWNDVFLLVISKSKQILRPRQKDKVKLVPWDTDSDETYFISVAAMMGLVILRLLLNFITTFRGAHIFQKF